MERTGTLEALPAYLCRVDSLDLTSISGSRMHFDEFLASREPAVQRAFSDWTRSNRAPSRMPDEKRMVGGGHLLAARPSTLAPTKKSRGVNCGHGGID